MKTWETLILSGMQEKINILTPSFLCDLLQNPEFKIIVSIQLSLCGVCSTKVEYVRRRCIVNISQLGV